MTDTSEVSPAEEAAQQALNSMFDCIQERRNFRLEAGAGAGKTFSLVKALKQLIHDQGDQLVRSHQKVACITYTNVATDEITRRTDGHPAVQASTIHAFCWGLLKSFQAALRAEVMNIPRLAEKINEAGGIGSRAVWYDLGHRRVTENQVFIHHDDVLKLMVALMERPKFRRILTTRFPVLLSTNIKILTKLFQKV